MQSNNSFSPEQFNQLVLNWFKSHGRKDLPWQNPITPYRVWLSEIMLQQTQVSTVVPYFQRFVDHFPTLTSLATASQEKVLELWAGLGYYARARNLLRTAQIVHQEFSGRFPFDLETLMTLPGIGRSTAGAISSIALGKAAPILDGNVKRVLTRFHAIDSWPGHSETTKQLWEIASHYTPKEKAAEYTQAIMDLGATVCTRNKPNCLHCPLQNHCLAYAQGNTTAYPVKKPSKILPVRQVQLLILRNSLGQVLLEKRPPVGIWGGLWSLPECSHDENVRDFCETLYQCQIQTMQALPTFRHTFSHYHLDISPIHAQVIIHQNTIMDNTHRIWYNLANQKPHAFAAPIKRLLSDLSEGIYDES